MGEGEGGAESGGGEEKGGEVKEGEAVSLKKSLYEIPPGCICLGDGLMGVKCEASQHARLKQVNPLTPEHQAFHAHLDVCSQCREHPFDLCEIGDAALRAAAGSVLESETDAAREQLLASSLDKHFGPERAAAIRKAGKF